MSPRPAIPKESVDTDEDQRSALRECLKQLLLTLQHGVEVNRRLISPEQASFQIQLEEGLVRFIARVAKFGISLRDKDLR